MLSRNGIKKRLEGVPPELCVAFAVRSALRVLPLLAVEKSGKPPFWYWSSQDRGEHFLAVLNNLQVGRIISVVRLDGFHAVARAAARAAYNDALLEDLDIIATCSPSGPLPQVFDKPQQKQLTSAIELFQRPLWPADELPILIQI